MPSSQSRSRSRDRVRKADRYDKPQKSAKLFVTNIDSRVSNSSTQNPEDELRMDLKQVFGKFGEIVEIKIKTRQDSDNSYAFLEYKSVEEAEAAL